MGTLVRASPSDDLVLNTTLGAVVNHTCDEGFVLQGVIERECLLTGEWSEPLPTCVGKFANFNCNLILYCITADCGDPGVPQNGSTSVTDTTEGAITNHTCNVGFVQRGAMQRECLPNGEWSEPLPFCAGNIMKLH